MGERIMKTILIALSLLVASSASADVPVYIQTVALEARCQGIVGMTAVSRVIQNRAKERRQTYDQVCLAPHQFSCWDCDGNSTQRTSPTARDYSRALDAWKLAESADPDEIWYTANLYHDTSVTPWWSRSDKVTYLGQVGMLVFYREAR